MTKKTKVYTEARLVCMTKAMVEAINNYRFGTRVPSEVEAVRRLIDAGLKAAEKVPES